MTRVRSSQLFHKPDDFAAFFRLMRESHDHLPMRLMLRMHSSMPFFLLFVMTLGCSNGNPKTHEVRGVVRFPDGTPLTEGTIEFEALDHEIPIMATSEIAEDGTFELGTFSMDDGAVEGRHRVVVVSNHEIGTGAERPGKLEQSKLHPRFADFKTSGLEFEVKPGKNEFNILIEYAPQGRRSRP